MHRLCDAHRLLAAVALDDHVDDGLHADDTVWLVAIYPGGPTHSISYTCTDGRSAEATYFARDVQRTVDRAADGTTRTVWTNGDGIQRIAVTQS